MHVDAEHCFRFAVTEPPLDDVVWTPTVTTRVATMCRMPRNSTPRTPATT
jgi:hypothetical protein